MDYQWPQSHAEQTDVLMPVRPAPPLTPTPVEPLPGDEPTVKIKRPKDENGRKPGLRKAGIIAGAVFGALAVLYTRRPRAQQRRRAARGHGRRRGRRR